MQTNIKYCNEDEICNNNKKINEVNMKKCFLCDIKVTDMKKLKNFQKS